MGNDFSVTAGSYCVTGNSWNFSKEALNERNINNASCCTIDTGKKRNILTLNGCCPRVGYSRREHLSVINLILNPICNTIGNDVPVSPIEKFGKNPVPCGVEAVVIWS